MTIPLSYCSCGDCLAGDVPESVTAKQPTSEQVERPLTLDPYLIDRMKEHLQKRLRQTKRMIPVTTTAKGT